MKLKNKTALVIACEFCEQECPVSSREMKGRVQQ
jgi:NAD-dependent dihydropyrimidine dehydrogenase PreA subunit